MSVDLSLALSDGSPLAVLLDPPLGWAMAVLFGMLWGSFFNVAIHRLGSEDARLMDLVRPPSHCPRCLTPIRAFDNVPVLGWLLLRGRCRACHAPISIRYPLVEICGAAIGAAVYVHFVLSRPAVPSMQVSRFIIYFFFVADLFVLALIDLDTMLLPEAITLPSIPLFFVLGRLVPDVPLVDAAIGLAVGYGALKGLQLGYAALTGREGLGGGDAMLMAIIGGFLGWRALPFTLGLGSMLGTVVSVPLLLLQRRRTKVAGAAAVAMQPGVAAPPHDLIATQYDPVATQQDPVATQQDPVATQQDEQDEPSLRHVEVPFGPFLVAGALLYLFFKDVFWAWMVGMADLP